MTTRILVVDILRGNIDPTLVSSILVLNAHRITDSSGESFAVRLVKERHGAVQVRAISDDPVMLSSGFNKVRLPDEESVLLALGATAPALPLSPQVEKLMRALFLRRVLLWPRFRAEVTDCLSVPPTLEELQLDLTPAALQIQVGTTGAIHGTVQTPCITGFDSTVSAHAHTHDQGGHTRNGAGPTPPFLLFL